MSPLRAVRSTSLEASREVTCTPRRELLILPFPSRGSILRSSTFAPYTHLQCTGTHGVPSCLKFETSDFLARPQGSALRGPHSTQLLPQVLGFLRLSESYPTRARCLLCQDQLSHVVDSYSKESPRDHKLDSGSNTLRFSSYFEPT